MLDGQVAYWRRQLGGLTTLELPTDRPRPPVQTFAGAWSFRALPPGLLERLRELGQREGATLFMTLLAAFAVLLSRLSGQDDVAIGAPIANRTRAELEGLIGFFVNTLVLRSDLSGDPSFRELLRRVRETALGAYAHQDLPFEKLVEELRPERHMSRNPLFQVALVLQDTRPVEHQLPGLVLRSGGGIDNRVSKFDLTLYAGETEPGGLAFDYSTDLFDAATADRMLGQLQTLLEAVVEAPDRRIADLPLLSAEERHRTAAWSGTTRASSTGAPARSTRRSTAQVGAHARPPRPSCSRSARSATASSSAARTSSRTTCWRWASGPRRAWASSSSARSSCRWRCSAS